MVVKANLVHNHDLPTDVQSSLPVTNHHFIPAEFCQYAEDMRGFRLPSDINDALLRMATQRGIPVTWTPRDIQNRYGMLHNQGFWKADAFLQRLLKDGRSHDYSISDDGVIDTIVWLMDNGDMSVLLNAADVVVFDNTFNTNSLGLKLGVFSTVDRFGCTRLVGCSLMRRENREGFTTVLAHFQSISGITFKVILTDGDLWLADAILATCPNALHFLCTWHLSKNLLRNVRACFGNRLDATSGWSAFLHKWWLICSTSDSSTVATFDDEWEALRQMVSALDPSGQNQGVLKALRYLGQPPSQRDEYDEEAAVLGGGDQPVHDQAAEEEEEDEGEEEGEDYETRYFNIYSLRFKWASRFTASVFTHGAASTQRGEGIFSEVKRRVVGGCSLVDLYDQLDDIVDRKVAANVNALVRNTLHQESFLLRSPLVESLSSQP